MAWVVMKQHLLACASLLLLTGCTSTHTPPTPPTRTATQAVTPTAPGSRTALGRPGCQSPSPINRGAGFPEVEGSSSDHVQLWGLIMADGPDNPVQVNEQVKIVWRMTGNGELHLTSIGPDGATHPLQWGPDAHTLGSTNSRPGQEWGAGYLFSEPGCWDLHAVRGNATADVWLNIAA